MKLLRNSVVVAAVGAALVLPLSVAHAEPAPKTVKVTSFSPPDNQGWLIDNDRVKSFAFPHSFASEAKPPAGTGSLQFVGSDPDIPKEKMFVVHQEEIAPQAFTSVDFDYRFDSTSKIKAPNQFYLILYIDTVKPILSGTWYDCKLTYLATEQADGVWRRLSVAKGRTAGPSTPANKPECATSVDGLTDGDKIFLIALNAGDESGNDVGMKGAFDRVRVTTTASDIIYDFEPATGCAQKGLPIVEGTAGNDLKNGTPSAEKIDLKAGNDMSDAGAGADCVLGAEGADRITGGAGDDEIQAGAGNDHVTAGPGRDIADAGPGNDYVNVRDGEADTVDCGDGNDLVVADRGLDKVAPNCEGGA